MKITKESFDIKHMIGARYINDKYSSENSAELADKFREIAAINEQLFELIPYRVVFSRDDHYESARQMRAEVTKTNVIYIYSGGNEHVFMTPEENLKGRAVHDVFAHMVCGCPFSFRGELNAYYEQRKHYPEHLWAVLFAEIPMQTAAYYYMGGFNFKQRAIEAPAALMTMCEPLRKDYSENSVLPSRSFQISEDIGKIQTEMASHAMANIRKEAPWILA